MMPNVRWLCRLVTRMPVPFLPSFAPMKRLFCVSAFLLSRWTGHREDEFRHNKPFSQTVWVFFSIIAEEASLTCNPDLHVRLWLFDRELFGFLKDRSIRSAAGRRDDL